MEKRATNSVLDQENYLSTGFTDFDRSYLIRKGDLIGIAGYHNIGKEDFIIDLFLNISKKDKTHFVMTSQVEESFMDQMKLKLSGLDEIRSLNGELNGLEFQRYVGAVNDLQKMDFRLSREIPFEDSQCRHIFIEDVHLLAMRERGGSMHEKMTNILIKLKEKALDENTVIFVGLELSKKILERAGQRPMLSDLHECSNISNICDQIWGVHRRDYYDRLDKPGMAEIIPLKTKRPMVDVELDYLVKTRSFIDCIPTLLTEEELEELQKPAFWDI